MNQHASPQSDHSSLRAEPEIREPEKKTENPFHVRNHEEEKQGKISGISTSQTAETINDELLVEQDGDFFWVLQRIIWSIVKIGLVLGVIAFLIWIIWGSEGNELGETFKEQKQKLEQGIQKTKKGLTTNKKEVDQSTPLKQIQQEFIILPERSALIAAQWHEWIEKMRTFQQKELIFQSLRWMDRAEAFFALPTEQLISAQETARRAVQVEVVLRDIRSMLEESDFIRRDIIGQITEFNQNIALEKSRAIQARTTLETTLQDVREEYSEKILIEKVQADQHITDYTSQLEVRHFLLRNMENYDKALRIVYDNIIANQKAIVENIQVVVFPGDPFRRLLTPTQWESIRKTTQGK